MVFSISWQVIFSPPWRKPFDHFSLLRVPISKPVDCLIVVRNSARFPSPSFSFGALVAFYADRQVDWEILSANDFEESLSFVPPSSCGP